MIDRRALCSLVLIALCGGALPAAHAQLRVEITSGVTDPIPLAVVPFAAPASAPVDVSAVIDADLRGSGRFAVLARERLPAQPHRAAEVVAADWRALRSDFVLVGRVQGGAAITIEFELVNVLTGQVVLAERVTSAGGSTSALRHAAHRVSDQVYQRVLGIRGVFATRIAYVSVDGRPPNQRFQLIVADADGEGARIVLESRQPLMSPAWSNDGNWLAYVSFEGRVSSVFVQQVRSGERRRVSARVGINGAPAWSPDDRRLALTLSGSSGNLDLYTLDLATQALTRITDDPGIDTEPVWSQDGRSLYFTSDRSGAPQIYRLALAAGEKPRRLTFGSGYAARPRVSPDGRLLAMVMLDGGAYRVAIQPADGGSTTVLSRGRVDESPSFAPNGAMLIYAGRERGQGVLATVSSDGLTTQRLKADRGEVREPAWGPFQP